MSGDGTGDTGNLTGGEWRAQLSDDLKANETFTPFKTVSDFAKAHLETAGKAAELEGKIKDALFVPGEKATDDERNAFFGKLGRPEKAEDYVIAELDANGITDEKVREAVKARTTEDIAWFRGAAHKLGLTKAQAESLFGEYAKRNGEYFAQMEGQRQKSLDDAMTALKSDPEWAGENLTKNLAVVNKAMEVFGSPELKQVFDSSGLGNNPAFVKFFYKVGKAMGEDKLIQGGPGGGGEKGWHYPSMEEK